MAKVEIIKYECDVCKAEYKHPNGYSARLYGKSSLSIYFDGKEVLHTGFRKVNTEGEVMWLLEEMPKFMEGGAE